MSLDGKLLGKAREELDGRRRRREAELKRRTAQVYAKSPRVRELDIQIRTCAAQAIAAAVSGLDDAQSEVERISEENIALQQQREYEIVRAGFPKNYLDDSYSCEKCHDTGFIGLEPCSCLMELYSEQQRIELSSLLAVGNESFDNFDLMLYDDMPDPDSGVSDRRTMEVVYETCLRYAIKFGRHKHNLFLNGPTGLGKTFLSGCIAKDVSERGFSVVYDTASSVFRKAESAHFYRGEGMDDARNEMGRIYKCDLLIIDDLGTEMTTTFSISALYDIINSRLINGRCTVINSNLSIDKMRERYSQQIMSRLEGAYQVLTFRGKDIRIKKKKM
jgi:DNA replication protein DnaC